MCVHLPCHSASICYPQPPERDSGLQSVQLDARERWPGQSEEQATEIVNRSFWAPAVHRVINVATAPLNQPLCPVQAQLLFGVIEGPKPCGLQSALKFIPVVQRKRHGRSRSRECSFPA